jgi:hypothetical protein
MLLDRPLSSDLTVDCLRRNHTGQMLVIIAMLSLRPKSADHVYLYKDIPKRRGLHWLTRE